MSYLRCGADEIDGDDIETACLIDKLIDVVVALRDTFELALLANVHEVFGFAVGVAAARFDFDEYQLVAIHRDDIDLTNFSVMEVSLDDPITEVT